jgi:hypothetical protein
MMTANFYRVWIDNTKSPFFRSSKLKTLDTAIRDYCATLDGPINAPGRQTAADTMLTAWDEWQRSKELEGGWWNSDRNNLSNGKLRFFANEMVPLMQARTPRAVVGAPVCFDSPHLTRAGNDGAEIAFSLAPKAIEVWAKSQRSGKRGDTFIGITQRSTGVCHMLPTYERCANNGGPLIDGGRMTNPATDKVKNRIFVNAPVRTVQDIHDTFGVPPRFGNVGRNFLVIGTKPRKRAITDRRQRAQPLKGRLVFAPPRHLARRTDAAAVGIQPETDQDLRVGVIAPRPPLHRGDGGIIPAQIQPPHQLPNRARGVIFLNQPLHLDGAQHHLAAIHTH